MAAEYVVIGLGRFGASVARELARRGQAVLAIDSDAERVQELAADVGSVVTADGTDEDTLRELQVHRMSCAVVAIGNESMEASILATALLRQMGLPRIIARSLSPLHARVLLSVGAHTVVNPEEEIGQRVARKLALPGVLERLSLSSDLTFVEMAIPAQFVERSLSDLRVRAKYDVIVVAVRREGKVLPASDPNALLRAGDLMMMVGSPDAIDRIASLT